MNPHGTILIDGRAVADTLQCCHCGRHWTVAPGSGRLRGFCRKCMGPTCGGEACDACVSFENKLDLYERGLLLTL